MSDALTSRERAYLLNWWRTYDSATSEGERDALRKIIELTVESATTRRIMNDLNAFHKERNK